MSNSPGGNVALVDYEKIPVVFHFLISVCYIAVGILLMTDMFAVLDGWKRILFGGVVIGYGIFRMYKAWKKYGREREGGA